MVKENLSTKEISSLIRKVLAKRYGNKNVSVTKGKGTASGWINAIVEVPKAKDCFCKERQPHCSSCCIQLKETSEEVRKIVYAEMEKNETSFMTYCADDGFNTDRDCFLLQTRIIKENV